MSTRGLEGIGILFMLTAMNDIFIPSTQQFNPIASVVVWILLQENLLREALELIFDGCRPQFIAVVVMIVIRCLHCFCKYVSSGRMMM